ncbi:MAG: hypothetical protein M3Q51_00345 [Pseudomonadota bacterium]|nr:hypothetical protein [Pseudomonadota bacterium]
MAKPRLYLLTVISPSLQPEHASVRDAVMHHSDGDFCEAFKQVVAMPGAKASGAEIPFVVAYLFSTAALPSEMGFPVLDRDRYFLVEVTTTSWAQGLSVARNWLDRHR